jgi:uncharacterized protein (DUF924 family)
MPPGFLTEHEGRIVATGSAGEAGWRDVHAFWFGPDAVWRAPPARAEWFRKDAAFDAAIRERFLGTWARAARGELDAWREEPRGMVALIVVADQFPRNMFRGEARAFATDALALALARDALERAVDRTVWPQERLFLYLPFEHAESLPDQDRSVALFGALAGETGRPDLLEYARRHRDIVARFGRFPHRNAALGRASTAEEARFLLEPGSGF